MLGGTPTFEGLGISFGWGGIAGSIGASIGFGYEFAKMNTPNNLAAQGTNAPNALEFTQTGEAEVLRHTPQGMTRQEWMITVKRIVKTSEFTGPNPGGGSQYYGFTDYLGVRQYTPHVVKVVTNTEGKIITAFIDDWTTKIIFGRPLLSLYL